MVSVDLKKLELNEFVAKNDARQHCKATFPLIGAHGSKDLATVYFEIEPGDSLGRHTDSAEEVLIILSGTAKVEVGDETSSAVEGGMVLVPIMVPHNLTNTGKEKLKVLGVFGGANNIVATFDNIVLPIETNVVDTALIG